MLDVTSKWQLLFTISKLINWRIIQNCCSFSVSEQFILHPLCKTTFQRLINATLAILKVNLFNRTTLIKETALLFQMELDFSHSYWAYRLQSWDFYSSLNATILLFAHNSQLQCNKQCRKEWIFFMIIITLFILQDSKLIKKEKWLKNSTKLTLLSSNLKCMLFLDCTWF